jgi:hypothetical protein
VTAATVAALGLIGWGLLLIALGVLGFEVRAHNATARLARSNAVAWSNTQKLLDAARKDLRSVRIEYLGLEPKPSAVSGAMPAATGCVGASHGRLGRDGDPPEATALARRSSMPYDDEGIIPKEDPSRAVPVCPPCSRDIISAGGHWLYKVRQRGETTELPCEVCGAGTTGRLQALRVSS